MHCNTYFTRYYEVRLMRGTAEYFNSLDASLRKQTELESLRAQIRDASTVELKDREDNERLKKQVRSVGNLRIHVAFNSYAFPFSSLPNEKYPADESGTSRLSAPSGTTKLHGCKILCARWRRLGAKTRRSCSRSSCRCSAPYSELQFSI